MPVAEFEEKQYETSANIELGLQRAAVFAAGQVLEAVVGYDAALHPPQNAPIWQLLGTNAPTGLQLVPNLWQHANVQPKPAQLPSTYVSLVLQYKRPYRIVTKKATQWLHWNKPYYRFPLLSRQQDILMVLEPALSSRAVVRYACTAFWKYQDLQTHQQSHTIMANSAFVNPTTLGTHSYWSYDSPGTNGYANPAGEEVQTETIRHFWDQAKTNSHKENLFEHLRGLAGGLRVPLVTDNTSPPWLTAFTATNGLDATQRQAVFDVYGLCGRLGLAGTTWFVADLEIANP